MRIVANRILTKWEIKAERIPSESYVRMEIFQSLAQELNKYNPLYFKEERDGDVEYRAELFIFSKDTFTTIMSQLRGTLSEGEFERVKDIFMNKV